MQVVWLGLGLGVGDDMDAHLVEQVERNGNEQEREHICRGGDDSRQDTQHYKRMLAVLTEQGGIDKP